MMQLNFHDSASFYPVLRGLDDFLVEVEDQGGNLHTGYAEVADEKLSLREHFMPRDGEAAITLPSDEIVRIEVL